MVKKTFNPKKISAKETRRADKLFSLARISTSFLSMVTLALLVMGERQYNKQEVLIKNLAKEKSQAEMIEEIKKLTKRGAMNSGLLNFQLLLANVMMFFYAYKKTVDEKQMNADRKKIDELLDDKHNLEVTIDSIHDLLAKCNTDKNEIDSRIQEIEKTSAPEQTAELAILKEKRGRVLEMIAENIGYMETLQNDIKKMDLEIAEQKILIERYAKDNSLTIYPSNKYPEKTLQEIAMLLENPAHLYITDAHAWHKLPAEMIEKFITIISGSDTRVTLVLQKPSPNESEYLHKRFEANIKIYKNLPNTKVLVVNYQKEFHDRIIETEKGTLQLGKSLSQIWYPRNGHLPAHKVTYNTAKSVTITYSPKKRPDQPEDLPRTKYLKDLIAKGEPR